MELGNEPSKEPNMIDFALATVMLSIENKAYLRTILDNQERILAHLQSRDIKEIRQESDDLYEKHLKKVQEETIETFNINHLKK